MLRKYTLGVAFDYDQNIVLIRKTKPDWQAGKLNFVGGKIERGEKLDVCMSREFREETSVHIPANRWKYVGKMYRKSDFVVHLFTTVHPAVADVRTTTEEEIYKVSIEAFEISSKVADECMPNLRVIYEFIKSNDFIEGNAELNIKFPKIVSK